MQIVARSHKYISAGERESIVTQVRKYVILYSYTYVVIEKR